MGFNRCGLGSKIQILIENTIFVGLIKKVISQVGLLHKTLVEDEARLLLLTCDSRSYCVRRRIARPIAANHCLE